MRSLSRGGGGVRLAFTSVFVNICLVIGINIGMFNGKCIVDILYSEGALLYNWRLVRIGAVGIS